tara:strand:- start:648 stop:878 length:231 start_codon:yes stop_codon:yes gene_type:complete
MDTNISCWLDSDAKPVMIYCPPLNETTFEQLHRLGKGKLPHILLKSSFGIKKFLNFKMSWDGLFLFKSKRLIFSLN